MVNATTLITGRYRDGFTLRDFFLQVSHLALTMMLIPGLRNMNLLLEGGKLAVAA